MERVRLDKLLADQGLGTRRELRDIIRSGRVQVNGKPERSPEMKIDPLTDEVSFDGRVLGKTVSCTIMSSPLRRTGRRKRFWICCRQSFGAAVFFRWDAWIRIPAVCCC